MSATVEVSQGTTPISASNRDKEALLDDLDDLLKRYLNLLDQYQNARQRLSSQLARGYMSIAQSNFHAANRVRYGQDFYDERMQALRTVSIEGSESDSTIRRAIVLKESQGKVSAVKEQEDSVAASTPADTAKDEVSKDDTVKGETKNAKSTDGKLESVTESASPNLEKEQEHKEKAKTGDTTDETATSSNSTAKPVDPIKWFGILVPPALRAAQKTFVCAVEESIPAVMNLSDELRSLEIEIGRARKKIRKM